MTKESYMALADFQTLWTDKIKPTLPAKATTYTKTEVDTAISNARGVFDGTTLVL